MPDSNQIRSLLNDIDPQLCACFAVRCSLRALPLLVLERYKRLLVLEKDNQPPFWYWSDSDVSENLFSLFETLQASIYSSVYCKPFPDITSSYEVYAPESANSVTYSILYAAEAAKNPLSAASYATDAAVYACSDPFLGSELLSLCLQRDLDLITSETASSGLIGIKTPHDLLSEPLWHGVESGEWKALIEQWKSALLVLSEGFDVWIDWYESRLSGKPLDSEKEGFFYEVPPQVRRQSAKIRNAYLLSLNTEETSPLNLVRVIFIGDGAVGKTSLIRCLFGETVVEGDATTTPGIDVKKWKLPNSEIEARLWDFGGQVMSHAMHQFFLKERCLYVVVVDAGTEREKREHINPNQRAEYWLEQVVALGSSAPVILVGNKADEQEVNFNEYALREKYKDLIVSFHCVSCTSTEDKHTGRFGEFYCEFERQLLGLDTAKVLITAKQKKLLKKLRSRSIKQAFITHKKFNKLCDKYEVGKVGLKKDDFLELLDNLGEITNFTDKALVLNPRWLTYGVHRLLYSEKIRQQSGLLSRSDVVEILTSRTVRDELGSVLEYETEKCDFIISAMESSQLCYQLKHTSSPDKELWVFPDKLPESQPDLSNYFSSTDEAILLEFRFEGQVQRSLMPNLIVSRHEEIQEADNRVQLVWQSGVILSSSEYQASARLEVSYTNNRLSVRVKGEQARDYLSVIRDKINQLLRLRQGINFTESVGLPISAYIEMEESNDDDSNVKLDFAPYARLNAEVRLLHDVTCSDSGAIYDLEKVMGSIMAKDKKQNIEDNGTKNIVINNIGGDADIGPQTPGNNNVVIGKIETTIVQRHDISSMDKSLETLMQFVLKHEADREIIAKAYAELSQIREYLGELETAGPETRGKLVQALDSVKDGSLGAIKLGNDIKDATETIDFLQKSAETVSSWLSNLHF